MSDSVGARSHAETFAGSIIAGMEFKCLKMGVCMYVCMIIISPYLLRHWLRLKDDEWPSAMHGSVGQLQQQQLA